MILAGTPTTTAQSGISSKTRAPAPTLTFFPITTLGITEAPIPIKVFSPTVTLPPKQALGARCT